MRIGIDASCWLNRRGFGRYARELVQALLRVDRRNEYVLFLDETTARDADALPSEQQATRVIVRTDAAAAQAAAADGSRTIRDLWRMRRAVASWRDRLDVFYFPADYTYFPIDTPARVIVTKHDMTDRRVPELLFPSWRSRFLWEAKIRLAMRRSDLVFTVSETSRRDIMEAFDFAPEHVRVVADAVDPRFLPSTDVGESTAALARYQIAPGERFLLYVGGISPHKNLATLVRAFDRWRRSAAGQRSTVSLVIVGDYVSDVFHSSYLEIRQLIDGAGLAPFVRLTGFVPDADLRHLYSAAQALVLPSFYEGFGLPVLEAMACGAPVIASNAGALPEVVGDAGLLFDAHSPEALAAVLERVLMDGELRRSLTARGFERAAQFSWDASAHAALAAFDDVVR